MNPAVYWMPSKYGKLLHHPFNESFMAQLCEQLPETEHEWRGNARWISDAYIREVEILVSRHFDA